MSSPLQVAVIGAGRWGKNHVRNLAYLPEADLRYVCDIDENTILRLQEAYSLHFVNDVDTMLRDVKLEAVVIATPAPTHFELARKCLLAGKHVFVEKPMCLSIADASELKRLAENSKLVLFVGHSMLYNPGIRKMNEILDTGELGCIRHMYFNRTNLGVVRKDENVWWSLAPHDISIAIYLMGQGPVSVRAAGECYLRKGVEDVVSADLRFIDGTTARIHVSWYDTVKFRRVAVVCQKGSLLFDDTEKRLLLDRRYFDSDFNVVGKEEFEEVAFSVAEPLELEDRAFVECIRSGEKPLTNGQNGLMVTSVLEAGQLSLDSQQGTVFLGELR